jgi:hypothetical protein
VTAIRAIIQYWPMDQPLTNVWNDPVGSEVIAAVLSAAILGFAALVWQQIRRRRAAQNEPTVSDPHPLGIASTGGPKAFEVEDSRCRIYWRINAPLSDVLTLNPSPAATSPAYLASIVQGPFHLKPDCRDAMHLMAYDAGDGWGLIYLCQHCDKDGSADCRDVAETTQHSIRAKVVEEIQRLVRQFGPQLERNGGRIHLQQPRYWDDVDERQR